MSGSLGFTAGPISEQSQPAAPHHDYYSPTIEHSQSNGGFFSNIKEAFTSLLKPALPKTNIDDMRIKAEFVENKINLKLSHTQLNEKFTFQGRQHYGRDIINHLQSQIDSNHFNALKADIGEEIAQPKQNVNAHFVKGMVKKLICQAAEITPSTKPDSTPPSYYLIGITIGAVIGAIAGAACFGFGSVPAAVIGAAIGGMMSSIVASTFNTSSGPKGPTVVVPEFPISNQRHQPNNNNEALDAMMNYNLLEQQQELNNDMNDNYD